MLPVKECTGCSACAHICPKGCIGMLADNNGFLYPHIDSNICVGCNMCEKACPVLNRAEREIPVNTNCYAAQTKAESVRKKSSSGGIFSAIAEKVLADNGVVYGASFDKNFAVRHIGISSVEKLDLLRRSKYVQSDLNNSFIAAADDLKQGKVVLFTGTPCQVEGLLSYLKKPCENLITMDFVCHGVPAPAVWERYKSLLERKYNSSVVNVNFRDKSLGWKSFSLRVELENGNTYSSTFGNDPYMKAFLANMDLRESCYSCKFKGTGHKSDITVADYWGIDKIAPEIDDDKGLSMLLVNTEKGNDLLDDIKDSITLAETDVEKAFPYNPCIIKPCERHNFSQYFLKNYRKGDFDKLVEECLNPSYITRFKRKVLQIKNGDV